MRLIRIRDVVARTGLSRGSVYDALSRGNFPRPVKLEGRSVGFVEAEVDRWIAARVNARDEAA
jgi:prophage regulatory protein